MTILRTDKIAGLESVNAITGSVEFKSHPTGNGTYLSYVDSDRIFNFGDGSFTIEFWMKPNTVDTSVLSQDGDNATVMDYGYGNTSNSANAWFAIHHNDQAIKFAFQNSDQITTSNFLTANTWHHVSINHVRTGVSGKTTIYGDGTAVGSMSSTQTFTDALTRDLTVGNQNNVNRAFDGKLSNVRICKGKALYTAAYTPPTRQLEVTPETVLLCCQSSQDVGMDATGKILTPYPNDSASAPPKTSTDVPDVGNDHTHGTVLEGNVEFPSLNYMTLPRGTTTQSNRGRGMVLGGIHPEVTRMETYSLISSSNGVEFGTLGSSAIAWGGATGNATRSLIGGGSGVINTIEYVTVAALGDAVDFGDLTVARRHAGPAGNDTRGIFAGGETAGSNTITNVVDYVTFASTGNAADFGDQAVGSRGAGGCGSPTRAIWGGGQTGPTGVDVIDYATFATTGNTTDFGNLTQARANLAGCSNNTRAVWGGGSISPTNYNIIDYVTIATTGNATDFGDLLQTIYTIQGCSASHIRGMWNGGYNSGYLNTIQYVTFATTGNSLDWGDMKNGRGGYLGCTSDCHGGLSE